MAHKHTIHTDVSGLQNHSHNAACRNLRLIMHEILYMPSYKHIHMHFNVDDMLCLWSRQHRNKQLVLNQNYCVYTYMYCTSFVIHTESTERRNKYSRDSMRTQVCNPYSVVHSKNCVSAVKVLNYCSSWTDIRLLFCG